MPETDWKETPSEQREKLRNRAMEIRRRIEEGLSYAFDRLLNKCMDTYFSMEERLEEFDRLFSGILQEIDHASDWANLHHLEQRIDYLEDSFEELDSELRGRPARSRHRRFSFFKFFRQWQSEQDKTAQAGGEIRDAAEAYQILGLSTGSDLKTVTAAFRRLIKGLHPDTRDGDRSQEPQLRKLLAAYQYIKNDFSR